MTWLVQWLLFFLPYESPLALGFYLFLFTPIASVDTKIFAALNILPVVLYFILPDGAIDNANVKLGSMTVNLLALLYFPLFSSTGNVAIMALLLFWCPLLLYFILTLAVPSANMIWQDEHVTLYVGNFMSARETNCKFLEDNGISHILELYEDDSRKNPPIPTMQYKQIQFLDRNYSLLQISKKNALLLSMVRRGMCLYTAPLGSAAPLQSQFLFSSSDEG